MSTLRKALFSWLFAAFMALPLAAQLTDCAFTRTFTTDANLASSSNLSGQTPCVNWRVTYSVTGTLTSTVTFQTSPDNTNWTSVPNTLCSSTVQPPCILQGTNPLTGTTQGMGLFSAYGAYVRVITSASGGTGTGTIRGYGAKGATANEAGSTGGTVTSVTILGTANQITAAGTCTITTTGTCTLSLPSLVILSTNTAPLPAPAAGTLLQLGAANGVGTRITQDAFGAANNYTFRTAAGTAAIPSAVQVGASLMFIAIMGYGATGYSTGARASMGFSASENWTDTAQGTQFSLTTTPTGSVAAIPRFAIDSGGCLDIGITGCAYSLDVSKGVGLTGTARFYDQTTTTGATLVTITPGASQTAASLTLANGGSQTIAGTLAVSSTSSASQFLTAANCSSAASPAVCSAASAGSVVVAAAATTVVVNTTAVTANSQILVFYDSSLGTKLGVTCNVTEPALYGATARTAATSFTITATAPITNPACFSYLIIN